MKHKIAKYLHRFAAFLERDIPGAFMNHKENQEVQKKSLKKETIEVKDTYEAAFYLCVGGKLVDLRKRKLAENKIDKFGFRERWYITLSDVPSCMIDKFRNGTAHVNVADLKRERLRVKKYANSIK